MSIGLFPDDKEIQEAIKVITESASDAAPYALAAIAIIILGLISGEIVAGGLVISEVIATLVDGLELYYNISNLLCHKAI